MNHPAIPTADTAVAIEQLPPWMQQALRPRDWGGWVVLAILLLAIVPIVAGEGMFVGGAHEVFLFRGAQYVDALLTGGLQGLMPDDSTETTLIMGTLPPLPGTLIGLVHALSTADWVIVIRWLIAVTLFITGAALHAAIVRRAGAASALIGVSVLIFTPLLVYGLPHAMGRLDLLLALASVSVMMWASERLRTSNHGIDPLLLAFAFAAGLLSDPLFAMGGVVLIVSGCDRRSMTPLLVSVVLGALISAFYWLPLSVDRLVWVWTTNGAAPVVWQSPIDLLRPLQPLRTLDLLAPPQASLGIPLVLLSAITPFIVIRQRADRWHLLMLILGIAALTAAFISTDPLRPLTFAALTLSLSASGVGHSLPRFHPRLRPFLLPSLLLLLGALSLPVWLLPDGVAPPDVSLRGRIDYQARGYGIPGVLPGASFPTLERAAVLFDGNTSAVIGLVVSVIGGICTVIVWRRRKRRDAVRHHEPLLLRSGDVRALTAAVFIMTLFVGAAWLLLRQPYSDSLRDPSLQAFEIRSEAGLTLSAYRITPTIAQPDDRIVVDLVWYTLRVLPTTYRVQVHLIDGADRVWLLTDPQPPSPYPTSRWLPRRFVRDRHRLILPADLPQGVYSLAVSASACLDGCDRTEPIRFIDARNAFVERARLPMAILVLR